MTLCSCHAKLCTAAAAAAAAAGSWAPHAMHQHSMRSRITSSQPAPEHMALELARAQHTQHAQHAHIMASPREQMAAERSALAMLEVATVLIMRVSSDRRLVSSPVRTRS